MRSPRRGALVMSRSARVMRVWPATLRHRTEQVHQGGQIVRAHVEHRPAARLVIERRVGVPAFVAGTGHERHGVQRLADPAVVDQLAAGLVATAEEGVGRAAEQHPGVSGRAHQVLALGALHRQRFLAPHMLAGIDGRPRHRVVRGRDGQVDHQIDRLVGQQFGRRQRARNAELRRLRRGALDNQSRRTPPRRESETPGSP